MFGCPICSERLDRLPGAQAQPGSTESQQKKEDLRVSCAPCGHIFHTFCIQKWLTQGGANVVKQCPCCRKAVPGAKTLPLYPDPYDVSLDESFVGGGAGGGHSGAVAVCDHSHFNHQLASLKKLTEDLRDQIKESEEMKDIQKSIADDYKAQFEKEKERSDSFMLKWRQCESYKDYAEQKEKEMKSIAEQLQQYELIDKLVKNVQDDVQFELARYTYNCNLSSMQKVLEIHAVIKGEYDSALKKLEKAQEKQETDRQEIARLRKKYNSLQMAHQELTQVHSNCDNEDDNRNFDKSRTGTTPRFNNNKMDLKMMNNNSGTPLLPYDKLKKKQSIFSDPSVDSDVQVMQAFNNKDKIKKTKLLKPKPLIRPTPKLDFDTFETFVQDNNKKAKGDDGLSNEGQSPILSGAPNLKRKFKILSPSAFSSSTSPNKVKKPSEDDLDLNKQSKSLKKSKLNNKSQGSSKSSQGINKTILLSSDDEEELLDVDELPLRGNIPGLKIQRRLPTTSVPAKLFTFKKK